MRSNVLMHTKTPNVTIQWNIPEMRYRNDVIRSVLFLHIRVNLGMMLARDCASCHADRSTLVMRVANNVQKLRLPEKRSGFKSYWPLVGPIEKQGSCTTAATKSQGARVIYQMCAAIPQQYIHRHISSISIWKLVVDATAGGCTQY